MRSAGARGPPYFSCPPACCRSRRRQPRGRITPKARYPVDRPVASPAGLSEAARLLAAAERPLIVAGGGAHSSGAAAELAKLQSAHGFPIATTLMGKGAVPEDHPLSLGVIGYLLGRAAPNREVRRYVETADVVMFVGARTNQNGTDGWRLFPATAQFVHIDIDGTEIGRNYDSLRLVGDARETLRALASELADLAEPAAGAGRAARLRPLVPERRPFARCVPGDPPAGNAAGADRRDHCPLDARRDNLRRRRQLRFRLALQLWVGAWVRAALRDTARARRSGLGGCRSPWVPRWHGRGAPVIALSG